MSIIDRKARQLSGPGLERVARVLDRFNISPDLVTLVGLVLTIGVAALAALGEMRWAGLAYLGAAVFDALDGTLARVSGKGSRFGAFLDSTIDRFEESIVLLGLAVYYARVGGLYEIPLILVTTVSSLMVSYTRARAEAVGVSCTVGFMTRVPRVAIMIVGMLINQIVVALALIAVTSLVTTFHRMYHVWRLTGGEAGGWGPPRQPFAVRQGPDPESGEDSQP